MTDHLGARVSLLLDGQLPQSEAEAAWLHVHACAQCQDLVTYEGWLKSQLAGYASAPPVLDEQFVGSLASAPARTGFQGPRARGLAVLGGGAVGAVVAGFMALGVGSVGNELRPPAGSIGTPVARVSATALARTGTTSALPLGTHRVSAGVPGVRLVP